MAIGQTLYTSADIRKAIIAIFIKSKGRRVAISAFVGNGAEAYLPKPKGIELVCWPSPSGTNPNALRALNKLGVKIFFSDRLHAKIYWTEDHGAVITSANLSTNAFGAGNLKEFGVLVPSDTIDIDRVISNLKRRKLTKKELISLDKSHRAYHSTNKIIINPGEIKSFLDWYQDKYSESWKLMFWDVWYEFSSNALNIAKTEYGISSPHTSTFCAKNAYTKDDWLLSIKFDNDIPIAIEWMAVDFITEVDQKHPNRNPDYPYEAVQLRSLKYYQPPFQIDERFRTAFLKALKKIGISQFNSDGSSGPLKKLIKLTSEYF